MYRDLPSRHTNRLPEFDYSSSNWYYVTICTHERKGIFGDVIIPVGARRGSPVMQLNLNGHTVDEIWQSMPRHHNINLDSFQIMPNHVHGIIVINHTGEPRLAPTLGKLIGFFKSECTKQIRQLTNNLNIIVWQRNYYEHIIRDKGELAHIRKYIEDNPKRWEIDKQYT